jgi:hypothetical protein
MAVAAPVPTRTVVHHAKRCERTALTPKERERVAEATYKLPGHMRGQITNLDIAPLKDARVRGLYRLKLPPFRVFFRVAGPEILVLEIARRDEHTYDNLDRLNRLAFVRRGGGVHVVEVAEAPPAPRQHPREVRAPKLVERQNPLMPFTNPQLAELGLDDATIQVVRTMAPSIDIAEALAERGVGADVVELVADVWREPARYLGIFDSGRVPTVEDARIDEGELAERLLAADSSDSVAALDEDEFQKVLRGSIEDWMFYLHPAQTRVVRHAANGPSRIRGGPGTGKTVAALHRARHLVRTEQAQSVLVTTFVSVLPPVWRTLLQTFAIESAGRIRTATVDSVAWRLVDDVDDFVPRILGDDDRRTLLDRCLSQTPGLPQAIGGPDNLRREFDEVIAGRGISSITEYLAVPRTGRGLALTAPQRALVWAAYASYCNALERDRATDFAHLRLRALELAEEGHGPRFDAVIVDEAQDLTETHVRLLAALDRSENHSGLMLVGDGQQAIYPGGFSLRSLGLDVRGRSFLLRTNWRNTQRIADAAEAAIGDLPYGDIEDGRTASRPEETPVPRRLGDEPELHVVPDGQEGEVLSLLVEDALTRGSRSDVAVLGRTNKVWQRAERILADSGVPTIRLKEYEGQVVDAVRVGTFARSKGLEFKTVILLGATPKEWEINPFWLKTELDRQEFDAQELRTLFVAMTRARDRLELVSGAELPAPLLRARDWFSEIDWR